jgi:hypothetical protein
MLKNDDKVIICVSPAGCMLGIDCSRSSAVGIYRLGCPVALIPQGEQNKVSASLQPFIFPCEFLELVSPSIVLCEDDMEIRFREKLRKNYNAYLVESKSSLVLLR